MFNNSFFPINYFPPSYYGGQTVTDLNDVVMVFDIKYAVVLEVQAVNSAVEYRWYKNNENSPFSVTENPTTFDVQSSNAFSNTYRLKVKYSNNVVSGFSQIFTNYYPSDFSSPNKCSVYVDLMNPDGNQMGYMYLTYLPQSVSSLWVVNQIIPVKEVAGRISFPPIPWGAKVLISLPKSGINQELIIPELESYKFR